MFNFTKRNSCDPAPESGKKYDAAIKEIERLEGELNQRTQELDQSCKAQQIMSEGVRDCVASLFTVQSQLQVVAAHLDRSNKQVFKLVQENKALKSSADAWFKRAIKLEFDVLTAQDGLKKIENERDVAVKTIEHLQGQLISSAKENSRGEH